MASLDIDEFLEAIRTVLIDEADGVAELQAENVVVYQHGPSDPDEDIEAGIAHCQGVSVLVMDLGGDSDAEAGNPEILSEAAVELYVDTTKRNRRKTPTLRTAGKIRDDIMQTLHRAAGLNSDEHSFYDAEVTGYRPIADPAYVVFRITVRRSIALHG
jgi:hypothetical protein